MISPNTLKHPLVGFTKIELALKEKQNKNVPLYGLTQVDLISTGNEERGVLWVRSIIVTLLFSCQNVNDMLRYSCIKSYSSIV